MSPGRPCTPTSSTTNCRLSSSRSVRPSAATRAACSSTSGRRAPSATGRSATCRRSPGTSSLSSTTRAFCPPGYGCAGPAAAKPRSCSSSRSAAESGRGSRARRAGCGRRCGSGRSSSSSTSARAAGALRLDGEPARRGAAAALHHRAPGRLGALPDRLRRPAWLGRRADRRAALHPRVDLPARGRARHPPRRARHVPAGHGETLDEHALHSERYEVEPDTWARIRGRRRASWPSARPTRVLESLARGAPPAGRTDLFMTPGFEFRRVDALLTNFHLPRSTLLALVMAFAGMEETRRIYARGDCRALPLLLVRRCHAGAVTQFALTATDGAARAGCSGPRTATCRRRPSCRSGRRRPSRGSTRSGCARSARRSSSGTRTTCSSARLST